MFNKIRHHFRRKAIRLVLQLIGLILEALSVSLILYAILVLVKPVPQTGICRGNVVLGSEPVEGVTMTLSKDSAVVASTLTGAAGEFEFEELGIGLYSLLAHKDVPEGFLTASADVEITGDGVTVSDLPLEKSHAWCMPGHGIK